MDTGIAARPQYDEKTNEHLGLFESACTAVLKSLWNEPNIQGLWSIVSIALTRSAENLALVPVVVECGLSTTMTADDLLNGTLKVSIEYQPASGASLLMTFDQQVRPYDGQTSVTVSLSALETIANQAIT